jgi:hypothetical protein
MSAEPVSMKLSMSRSTTSRTVFSNGAMFFCKKRLAIGLR